MVINGINNRSINIDRLVLIEALKNNRETHAAEYAEALVDFEAYALAQLQQRLKLIKKSGAINNVDELNLYLEAPKSHLAQYDDVIEMLAYSIDDVINIDSTSFKAYVKNEWAWSESFKVSSALYKTV